MSPPLSEWWNAFLVTLACEIPVYGLLLSRRFPRWWMAPAVAVAANAVTHPAFWYLAPRFEPYEVWLATWETAIVVVEAAVVYAALVLFSARPRRLPIAIVSSFIANALSLVVGAILSSF